MSDRDPGVIYVSICGASAPLPVPATCPECGRPVRRTGNRHHHEAMCKGYMLRIVGGTTVRDCRWRSNVYHVSTTRILR